MTTGVYRKGTKEVIASIGDSSIIINRKRNESIQDTIFAFDSAFEQYRWIPCTERLPEVEKEVLICTERGTITTAIYEDGKMDEDESSWVWHDIDYAYDEEADITYVPEGWYEYEHFCQEDEYDNSIDEVVVKWMPLPEPYKGEN
jgi:hypothetical protein